MDQMHDTWKRTIKKTELKPIYQ